MPEGHTIHRIARHQFTALGHQTLAVTSPQGRFTPGATRVDGQRLEGIDAWGKHLFYRFDNEALIHVHLGLFGKFFRFEGSPPPTTRQVRLRLAGAGGGFDLTGPTACEVIDRVDAKRIADRLGPDPLRRDADPAQAWAKVSRRRSPIGVAVMDQSVVSGVGNVFRAESLFLHGIHPLRPCHTLTRAEWDSLWDTLVQMLRAGVRAGSIVTVSRRDRTVRDGRTRYVYKQDHCGRCGSVIRRWDLAGRWAYACEHCQPPWAG